MSNTTSTEVEWTVKKLIGAAQGHDRRARGFRENNAEDHVYFDYSSSRKLAFDARKWARSKLSNQDKQLDTET